MGVSANNTPQVQAKSYSTSSLSSLNYSKDEIVTVNNNKPSFSAATKSKSHGAWQKFSELDTLNRAHTANALLNKKLMPTTMRSALTWNPTGWHNKRIKSGWLYNRSHLIGYQLTGENNNPRNLITGTRELNDPNMLKYENKVATYIKASNKHYIRYRVTPIYKGNNLLASGVQMEAQSIGDNSVHFNVYIFNVQPGMVLNYKDGTSKVGKSVTTKKKTTVVKHKKTTTKKKSATKKTKTRVIHNVANRISTARYTVVGNKRSKIYHVMSGQNYHMSSSNAVYFSSEAAAKRAGYRKSLR
ncbi:MULTISPECIES: DNA/RNA non-specific endonuclease [unclassified Lactobacillus]|uniref:DNA/RNA non-specific endonuclease n=1 Tax=unclassified Lactobacillus TaxID=2620435 RepID=UPI00223F3A3A|nr:MULTISPECIES: DNA/RNA non-specific endonuclease [unclassified Lactobacillus]